jgi:hypothetical protein
MWWKREVVQAVRSLIGRIVISPKADPAGRDLERAGQLAAPTGAPDSLYKSMGSMVAGEGLEPPTRGL